MERGGRLADDRIGRGGVRLCGGPPVHQRLPHKLELRLHVPVVSAMSGGVIEHLVKLGDVADFPRLPAWAVVGNAVYFLTQDIEGWRLLSAVCPHLGGEVEDCGHRRLHRHHRPADGRQQSLADLGYRADRAVRRTRDLLVLPGPATHD